MQQVKHLHQGNSCRRGKEEAPVEEVKEEAPVEGKRGNPVAATVATKQIKKSVSFINETMSIKTNSDTICLNG